MWCVVRASSIAKQAAAELAAWRFEEPNLRLIADCIANELVPTRRASRPGAARRAGAILLAAEQGGRVSLEGLSAGGAAVEHMTSRIDRQLHALGLAKGGHLVEDQLRGVERA